MVYIVDSPFFLKHLTGPLHPESPQRYSALIEELEKSGLKHRDNTLLARRASLEELALCHGKEYIRLVEEETAALRDEEVAPLSTGDVMISPHSFEAACFAAGAVLTALDAVFDGQTSTVFAPVRPPGHHACRNRGMGFCLFNNVAIGASYALVKKGVKRAMVIDFDVHHGNGTEELFEENPSLFYFSTHAQGIYPGTGEKSKRNHIVNCPISPKGDSREQIFNAFQQELLPKAELFQPELILISAGFDAHRLDPIGPLNLETEDYGTLTQMIQSLARKYAQGRIVSVLEGGYHIEALATSVKSHVEAL